MTREQAEKEIRDTFTEVWADGIIKALEPKPMEKFKSVKDHIFKLVGDYKCWDNRLTDDEALELCHILEQEPILNKVKQAREEIENRATYDGIYIDRADVLEILDKLIKSEET